MPPHIVAGKRVQNRFINDICNKYDLQCYAAGGAMQYDIKVIKASFSSRKSHNLEQARELYVNVVSELIEQFNNDLSVQPFLHKKPFDITNGTICFTFENSNRTPTTGINHIVPLYETDLIRYFTRDPTTDDWIKIHEETYEKAKAILQKGNT